MTIAYIGAADNACDRERLVCAVGGLMRHSRCSRRSFHAKSYNGAPRPMKMGTIASP